MPYSRIRGPKAVKYIWSERVPVGTGLRIAVPEGYEAEVRPRSGLAAAQTLTTTVSAIMSCSARLRSVKPAMM